MLKSLVAGLALSVVALGANAAELMETTSPHSVDETVTRFVSAAEKAGATIFAQIDHAEGASSVGTEMEPTMLIVVGNPKIGTPVIAADRRAGLDLPLRVLVWEADGKTMVAYEQPSEIKTRHGVEGADASFEKMQGALDKLVGAATQAD
ncbi:DUF302 domain-containing protein [Pseudohoeflea coraliihabitans]|uniref:DUF302 domain-containing protein n=1 Tax=Pseudohoeflea coraliihabitans TaxID=2860393 RepID=A0ABS6WSP3_9HYPH|nr:DUF302 domain-containing protein [Pseudohoeflea sp. DP4N28-3]MBW3098976.1 DUF302 domain-containing protein [Pseudohoeflea sp. DP4N28-3]